MKEEMNISQYLITLLTEKGIYLGYNIRIKSDSVFGDHTIPLLVLIEFIENLDPNSQKKIRETLVRIDFQNGNILHFFKFLAEGMVKLKFTETSTIS